jgi:hypothetical protein
MQLHLDLRLRGISRTTVSIRYICHICHIRQRFAETFGVGVSFGGFPQTAGGFGVFDIPKSIGLVWWSLPLPWGNDSQVLQSLLIPQVAT